MTLWRAARAWLSPPGPAAAVEIAPDCVTAVALGPARTGPLLLGYARRALPAGAVVPGVTAANLRDREGVAEAVREVLGALPRRPARVALVVPDTAARVSLLRFDTVPRRTADLAALIRWQVQRSVPFRLEDAQLAYALGAASGDSGRECVVVAARREVVAEYEQPCVAAGVRPGLVELAAFGLVNGCLAGGPAGRPGDWLLVHAGPGYNSVAIVRGEDLVCFRSRPGDRAGDLSQLVHQTLMYYEDRLQGAGIRTVRVAARGAGGGPAASELTQALAQRVGVPVEPVTAHGVRTREGEGGGAAALEPLAASLGVLLGDRRRAA